MRSRRSRSHHPEPEHVGVDEGDDLESEGGDIELRGGGEISFEVSWIREGGGGLWHDGLAWLGL